MKHVLKLSLLPGRFAVCRLAPDAPIPSWATQGTFSSVTRTPHELSIVSEESLVPAHQQAERGRRLIFVHGPLAFSLTGVLSALASPLAQAGVSIFAVSTYDTDYLLVHGRDVETAIGALESAGHTIQRSEDQ